MPEPTFSNVSCETKMCNNTKLIDCNSCSAFKSNDVIIEECVNVHLFNCKNLCLINCVNMNLYNTTNQIIRDSKYRFPIDSQWTSELIVENAKSRSFKKLIISMWLKLQNPKLSPKKIVK